MFDEVYSQYCKDYEIIMNVGYTLNKQMNELIKRYPHHADQLEYNILLLNKILMKANKSIENVNEIIHYTHQYAKHILHLEAQLTYFKENSSLVPMEYKYDSATETNCFFLDDKIEEIEQECFRYSP